MPHSPLSDSPDFLQPLTSEAASLAHSLRGAPGRQGRTRLRDAGDAQWTAETPARRRAAASAREPAVPGFQSRALPAHAYQQRTEVRFRQRPRNGARTNPLRLRRHLDRPGSADARPRKRWTPTIACASPDQPHYTLRRVWLTKEEENGYYSLCHEASWPLAYRPHPPSFRAADWSTTAA